MATSIHSGLKLVAGASYGGDDDPVGAVIWRDGIANGLLHCADSYAQVRVNVAFADASTFGSGAAEYISGPAAPTAGQWFRVAAPFGPWPLTLHADGTPYKLRVRIAAASTSGGSVQTLRVVIAPDAFAALERDTEADSVYEVTTSSTTPAWLGGTSQGSIASGTMLTVSAEQAAAWITNTEIFDAVSSATPRTVQQCLVSAHVFAKSASGSETTRFHALHIAEYVGT